MSPGVVVGIVWFVFGFLGVAVGFSVWFSRFWGRKAVWVGVL